MNKECKRVIRDIQDKNFVYARNFLQSLYKLKIIPPPPLPNYAIARDESHKQALIAGMININCRDKASHLAKTYNQERIQRIRFWRMVVH